MKTVLQNRSMVSLAGVLLCGCIVWFLGPYVSYGDLQPLAGFSTRIAAITAIVVAWAVAPLMPRLRDTRARPPWYLQLGPLQSGKTALAVNAGLSQGGPSIASAAAGSDGSRTNCRWWTGERALIVEAPGLCASRSSKEVAYGFEWTKLLRLVGEHRSRNPLNGVLVVYSVSDLINRSGEDLHSDIAAVRQCIDGLEQRVQYDIPVYLVLTKTDVIPGFREYFGQFDSSDCGQVWGFTFELEDTVSGRSFITLPGEFDLLVERLNQGLNDRLCDEQDLTSRRLLFGFPARFAMLKARVVQFAIDAFRPAAGNHRSHLRGVYFVSAIQTGELVDPAERQALPTGERCESGDGTSRPHFIERLLHEVIVRESDLVSNGRLAARPRRLIPALTMAICLSTAAALIALTAHHLTERADLARIELLVGDLDRIGSEVATRELADQLPRLDLLRRIRDLANRDRDPSSRPGSVSLALDQGRSIHSAAVLAYDRELNAVFGPWLAALLARRIATATADSYLLEQYVRDYAILANPDRHGVERLESLAISEWERVYASDPEVRSALHEHLAHLLTGQRLRSIVLDETLIARARAAASMPVTRVRSEVPCCVYDNA